jgi:hypothetical protein
MRGSRLVGIPAAAIAIASMIIVLLGLVVGPELGVLSAFVSAFALREATDILLQIVTVLVAVTVFIGLLNLLLVHAGRVRRRASGWPYSIVLIVSGLGVIAIYALERAGALTTEPALSTILLEDVQVAIESALAGLLLFALVYGAYGLMRHGVSLWRLLFTASVLVVLLGALPLGITPLTDLRDLWLALPVSAGARGLLLGIALAVVVTAVRILTGQDRSYRE